MSKCDVRIVFDRGDRTFRGGEAVTGRVYVEVNQDVNANGVVLEHFWRTHGSGNTATGNTSTRQLYSGPLQAGQALELPFEVVAPPGPPSYHGHHLNIDHYLKARVDVPWAFDPKEEEEYLLAPSGEPYAELPTELSQVSKAGCRQFGVVVGSIFVVFGIIFPFPIGLVAIPIGALIMFFAFRKQLAEKRLGNVQVVWGPEVVSPGSVVPIRVSFTPSKAAELNEIRLKLTAREVCVSGSGTNSTTHTHPLHEETVCVARRQRLTAHQPVEFTAEVPIPDMPAYTFHASDNRLEWMAELKIDQPMWPDWVDKKQLVVRATPESVRREVAAFEAEHVHASHVTGEQIQTASGEHSAEETVGEPYATNVNQTEYGISASAPGPTLAPQTDVSAVAPHVAAQVALGPLGEILAAINAESRYSQGRERIAQRHVGQSFDCPLTVRRTERTYDYHAKDPYRDGRTIHGTLAGTRHDVVVQMKSTRNQELDRLHSGDEFRCQATPVKWNSVYDRLEMQEV
jgi:hypothetical protein